MHQKANNPLIQGFQLEKIFFPVRNIFFSNWALFSVQLGVFRLSRYRLLIFTLRICKDYLPEVHLSKAVCFMSRTDADGEEL